MGLRGFVVRAIRRVLRGMGYLHGYGHHPGTATLVLFVVMGTIAGAERGAARAVIGAGVMLAVFGPMYLIGAHGRGRDHERRSGV